MEAGKLSAGKKPSRLLLYVVLSVTALIVIQCLAFENRWRGLEAGFQSWKSGKLQIFSGRAFESQFPDDSLELRESLKRVARCSPSVFSGREKLPIEEIQCLREVLTASLDNGTFTELKESAEKVVEEGDDAIHATSQLAQEIRLLNEELKLAKEHLEQSVNMMKLKDLKEPGLTHGDTNWFMSSLYGKPVDGRPEEFRFPSSISQGRLLCVQGNHTTNGTMNRYGFAWKGYLPPNSTFLPGLTMVADNYWDYVNPWHSMSAVVNFASWRARNKCLRPERLVIYHWGEVVPRMGDWITKVLHASLGKRLKPETFSHANGGPVCFEDAIVHRRGLGGMSRQNLNTLFDMIRCKVYKFCRVERSSYFLKNKDGRIDLTILARSGAREFSNLTEVIQTVSEQCKLVAGCKVNAVPISSMTFCEQVKLMSKTDILLTSHGAQLTNMMFMPRGGSVMEMFPKGWLEFAGVGQYIYSWLTDWTGLNHEGTWRDPQGPDCPYQASTDPLKCFFFFKDRPVGLNRTHLSAWTSDVLQKLRSRTVDAASTPAAHSDCECGAADNEVFED